MSFSDPDPTPPMDRRIRPLRLASAALLALLPVLAACSDDDAPTGPVPGLPPTVLGVQPGVVDAGGSATVRGLNFAGQSSANEVTFGDLTASVGSASETSLSISLPAPTELPCRPTRRVPLRVSVAGRADTIRHRFSVAPSIGLEPGQFRAFTTPNSGYDCREFPASGDEFLVSVFNSSRSPGVRIGTELIGKPGAGEAEDTTSASGSVTATGGRGISAGRNPISDGGLTGPPRLPPFMERVARANRGHRDVLRTNRRLVERMKREGEIDLPGARSSTSAPDVPTPRADRHPQVGDHVQIRVPDLRGGLCSDFTEVTGRVAHVTEHAVLLSDTANAIDGRFDDRLREMGDEFEQRMWPVIRDNYGDPLRLDDQLNDDDRFYMLFTPAVNDFGNVLAFVFSGDFFSRSECASSDEAEVFYSRAPTRVDPAGYFDLSTTAGWQQILRPTLVHEVKHLAAYAERIGRDLPFETTWLEESTAHMAEELYARRVFGFSQGSNAQYENTVGCAFRPTGGSGEFSACEPGSPYVMVGEFSLLYEHMRNSTGESPLHTCNTCINFRGSGWWLLRWAVDHAPISESEFLQAMTTSPQTGIENLEARVGRDWTEILADWTLSLAVDDRQGADAVERPELSVPSWDVRDIYLGLNQDFSNQPGIFDRPYPLEVRTESYGSFSSTISGLRGGSAGIVRLVGRPEATQLLELTGGSAGPLPPFLRMSVVRMP